MNAYELADELEDTGKFFEDRLYIQSATMIRQQADRIAELEKPSKQLSKEDLVKIYDKSRAKYSGQLNWLDFAISIIEEMNK